MEEGLKLEQKNGEEGEGGSIFYRKRDKGMEEGLKLERKAFGDRISIFIMKEVRRMKRTMKKGKNKL
jgi:hypothetical protein